MSISQFLGLQTGCHTLHALSVASGDPNSVPYTCMAGTLSAQPSSWSMQNCLIFLCKHTVTWTENKNHAMAGVLGGRGMD